MNYDVSLIIPFLNEKENLPTLVSRLNDYFASEKDLKAEVIFVDDGSTDGSTDILRTLTHIHYTARLITLSKNFGSHAALRAGILHSRGNYLTFLPADLQDPLDLVGRLYGKCREGFDTVFAVRSTSEVSLFDKFFIFE